MKKEKEEIEREEKKKMEISWKEEETMIQLKKIKATEDYQFEPLHNFLFFLSFFLTPLLLSFLSLSMFEEGKK